MSLQAPVDNNEDARWPSTADAVSARLEELDDRSPVWSFCPSSCEVRTVAGGRRIVQAIQDGVSGGPRGEEDYSRVFPSRRGPLDYSVISLGL